MSDSKRPYRQRARARAAAETRSRVIEAAVLRFGAAPYDDVSLKDIAEEAGVGLQTVVRVGGSKESLFASATERLLQRAGADLLARSGSDLDSSIAVVMEVHEAWGAHLSRMMAQEERIEEVAALFRRGRDLQIAWIEAHLQPELGARSDEARARLVASLLLVTGTRAWYVLRRVHGLSAEQTRLAMIELARGLLGG